MSPLANCRQIARILGRKPKFSTTEALLQAFQRQYQGTKDMN